VKARYGSPRPHAELVAQGLPCCVNTVARLMREHGIAAKTKRKFRRTTDSNHDRPVAENILDRQFEPEAPNQAWTADITYVATGEGWLYLAAVEDLYSRGIVGWSMGSRIDSRLVVDALEMAVSRRLPGEGLVAHSDRGSQYASEHYQRILAGHGIACSMSRRANCWDNAPMESFFASLKKERTTTTYRQRRCRRGYNRGSRMSVGLARTGPLLSGASRLRRRSCTMPDRTTPIPPRA
jgi:putative transposase